MHVELNDDMKALYAIREMTRTDRNRIGGTAVCRAFNIPDVHVHIFELPHSISGNLDQIMGASCSRPLESFQNRDSRYATLSMPNNIAGI